MALENIAREFPSYLIVQMNEPGDFPHRPRDRTPVFYGSYDWHSCVEMHWVLVRLLKVAAGAVPATEIRAVLDAQFTAEALRREAEFITGGGRSERPYGWGWALSLIHELAGWTGDEDAKRWAAAMEPLATVLTDSYLEWLPIQTYPVRSGLHPNSSFGLSRALPFARMQAGLGQPALDAAIEAAAARWYLPDTGYPGGWEPSGHDFLSPALTEAELMARLLAPEEFAPWLEAFLPGLAAGEPAALFSPVVVSDSSDGQIAHLHGLNLSRAWCWRRLAETLPAGDQRIGPCLEAMQRHADAALPHVVGDDYMVGHWLAAYAVLLFS
ncbi:MAG: DUF2891 domain-containing protein [Streptosporangiaceae bacterium]